ncbi:MAG: hypothetical protein M3Z04_15090 [Chloroflexota bacterium]|nr:hypothetical protein [Chloroflexota bacterium]
MNPINNSGNPAPSSGPGNYVPPPGYAAYPPPYSGPSSYTPPAGYAGYPAPVSGLGRYPTVGSWHAYPLVGHPNLAALVEIGVSLFGLLGIGHLAAGRIRSGVLLLLASLAYMTLGWILFLPLIVATCGLAFCFGPLLWLVPVFSGLWLRHTLLKRQTWGP